MVSGFGSFKLRQFPPVVWSILLGGFLVRGAFYMVWPFLAVILYRKFGLSATVIGLLLSLSAVGSAVAGFCAGALSDYLGRKSVMIIAGMGSVIGFVLLAFAKPLWVYVVAMSLVSMSRAMWDAPAGALIGDRVKNIRIRELALQLRYFLINCGAAIGPLAGVYLGMTGEQTSFILPAIFFVVLIMVFIQTYDQTEFDAVPVKENKNTAIGIKGVISILIRDHYFLVVIIANIITLFIYAHMDSTLLQYLERSGHVNTVSLFATLILINALTVVFAQFPMLKLMGHWQIKMRVLVGLVLLAISQLWFAFNPMTWLVGWYLATFFLSLGEAILFPTMTIQVDRLAPEHLRGAYFGATSLYALGWALSPIAGGVILDIWGGTTLFMLCFSLCLMLIWLYQISDRFSRGTVASIHYDQVSAISESATKSA